MSWELWVSDLVPSWRFISEAFLLYLKAVYILKAGAFQDTIHQHSYLIKEEGSLSLDIHSALGTSTPCAELYDE